MSGTICVQNCGPHKMAYPPPDIIAEFLEERGLQVEVIRLDYVDADAECASNALVLLRNRRSEH